MQAEQAMGRITINNFQYINDYFSLGFDCNKDNEFYLNSSSIYSFHNGDYRCYCISVNGHNLLEIQEITNDSITIYDPANSTSLKLKNKS